MQHDDVYHVDEHDFCDTTNYCKRCGLAELMVKEQGYKCRFSLNMIAISHIRRKMIFQEKIAAEKERFQLLLEEIRKDQGFDDA